MPNFNEENSNPYNPLFVKPEDPAVLEQAEQLITDINKLKNLIEKADDLLKNGKLSSEARLKLEAAVAIYGAKLEREQTRYNNIVTQYGIQLQ